MNMYEIKCKLVDTGLYASMFMHANNIEEIRKIYLNPEYDDEFEVISIEMVVNNENR